MTILATTRYGHRFLDHAARGLVTEKHRGYGAPHFGRGEVLDHVFLQIGEAVRRYDCDGLELDFNRFPKLFKDGPAESPTENRNCLVERVRQILDEMKIAVEDIGQRRRNTSHLSKSLDQRQTIIN